MASPYFAALQSGGIVGDMSRRRGRMGMLAQRGRLKTAPAPVAPATAPTVGGGGFMSSLARRLGSYGAPAAPAVKATRPSIKAMPAGPELMGPSPGFEAAAPQVQGSLMKALGGGGGPAAGIFSKLAGGGFTGRGRGAAPVEMAMQGGGGFEPVQQPVQQRALRSFGGGFGRMRGGGFE